MTTTPYAAPYRFAGRGFTGRATGDTMTMQTDNLIASTIQWVPAADGLSVGKFGVQRDGGAVGPHELHIVRRRKASGQGYEYGLAWVRDRLITSYLFGATHFGGIADWPWDEGCSSAVTWFQTRRSAFAAAVSA